MCLLNLHSILVKSIPSDILFLVFTRFIYIPFWLNLYNPLWSAYSSASSYLHSILVKSIRRLLSASFCTGWNLHSILVKSILQSIFLHDLNHPHLHSILVKSIQRQTITLILLSRNLHSILVKSIRSVVWIFLEFMLNLHSILVKSIRSGTILSYLGRSIYIPFWLNLYLCRGWSALLLITIYIPFWLNLYVDGLFCCRANPRFTFHSG